VARTISRVEPDYEEAQLMFGWMKASSVTSRLELLATDTISLLYVKSRWNARNEATDTVSLDTLTINTEGVYIVQIYYSIALHMTGILEPKQGILELKQVKQFLNLPGNVAFFPTENFIEKREHRQSSPVISMGTMSVSKNLTQRAYRSFKSGRPNQ
jgi:hypothetical protein